MKKPHRKAVLVEWVDAGGCGEWVCDADGGIKVVHIWTLGWLIKETKRALIVSASTSNAKGRHVQSNAPIAIPRCAVLSYARVSFRSPEVVRVNDNEGTEQ